MGNHIGLRRKAAKVMKIDGTTIRFKPPARADDVLRQHPTHSLLDADEVRQVGIRARPLHPDHPLKPGKLYFLVELPRLTDDRAPRRAWSGSLHVSAKDRLENLMLSRRAVSDITPGKPSMEVMAEGSVRLKLRLPKSQVTELVQRSASPADAAEKIMELCISGDGAAHSPMPRHRSEKRTRFLPMPEEIIA
ncbi:hypothetical protein J5N97_005567 [Dioscorea zingiberensis]|uniref:Uncharacterized protein n=1 Tax=Dioscorea zingiberensis TaxID=325984 RepID=A0A9D5HSS8_9LILI|nr:hypothetical protein J5N97_005567 [Dioscorea zingiberensis]